MIEIKDFSFRYEGSESERFAVEDITMSVENGDFVGITGPSGAGKTTLVQALAGIIPHCIKGDFYGSVVINGVDTVESSVTDIAKILGIVCQDIDSAMVSAIVEDEILYGLENFGIPADEIERRVEEVLVRVGIEDLRYRKISSLSGGQKQKVAVCAILAMKPKILVLDEPTGELDPQSSRRVFSMLSELSKEGITVIVVEQKIMLLCEFAKKLAVLDKGKLLTFGSTDEVLKNSRLLEGCGVNCPRVVTLANRLSKMGVSGVKACADTKKTAKMLGEMLNKGGEQCD